MNKLIVEMSWYEFFFTLGLWIISVMFGVIIVFFILERIIITYKKAKINYLLKNRYGIKLYKGKLK